MRYTYSGSCHCGNVASRMVVDCGGRSKCNCRYYRNHCNWITLVELHAFKLSRGDESRSDYARKLHDNERNSPAKTRHLRFADPSRGRLP